MPNTKYLINVYYCLSILKTIYSMHNLYLFFCLLLLEFKETYLLEFLNLTGNNSIDIVCSEYIFAFLKRHKK